MNEKRMTSMELPVELLKLAKDKASNEDMSMSAVVEKLLSLWLSGEVVISSSPKASSKISIEDIFSKIKSGKVE